jgi:hypothetical protein
MTQVYLPTPENTTGTAYWSQVFSNDAALRNVVNGELGDDNIEAGANIQGSKLSPGSVTAEKLATGLGRITWYAPKVIATEESRINTAYGALTTADEIKSVILPENGLIEVNYQARVKSSASSGFAALFLGANQLKVPYTGAELANFATNEPEEARVISAKWNQLFSFPGGLVATAGSGADMAAHATTGQIIGAVSKEDGVANYQVGAAALSLPHGSFGGAVKIFAAAGTYNISVQYKASSGSVTAKERKLWVSVLG